MSAFTANGADPMLNWLTGYAGMSQATHYITTFSGDPQGAGAENINTLNGSANRVNLTAAFSAAAAASSVANASVITFTTSAAGSATVDHLAIYDAITGGNLLASCAITSKLLGIGDGLAINIGSCTLSIS